MEGFQRWAVVWVVDSWLDTLSKGLDDRQTQKAKKKEKREEVYTLENRRWCLILFLFFVLTSHADQAQPEVAQGSWGKVE